MAAVGVGHDSLRSDLELHPRLQLPYAKHINSKLVLEQSFLKRERLVIEFDLLCKELETIWQDDIINTDLSENQTEHIHSISNRISSYSGDASGNENRTFQETDHTVDVNYQNLTKSEDEEQTDTPQVKRNILMVCTAIQTTPGWQVKKLEEERFGWHIQKFEEERLLFIQKQDEFLSKQKQYWQERFNELYDKQVEILAKQEKRLPSKVNGQLNFYSTPMPASADYIVTENASCTAIPNISPVARPRTRSVSRPRTRSLNKNSYSVLSEFIPDYQEEIDHTQSSEESVVNSVSLHIMASNTLYNGSLLGGNAVSVRTRARQQSAVNSISRQITPYNDSLYGDNAVSVGPRTRQQLAVNSISLQMTPSNDDSLFGGNAVSVGTRTRQQSAVNSVARHITPSNGSLYGGNAVSVGPRTRQQLAVNNISRQITPSNDSLFGGNAVSVATGIRQKSAVNSISCYISPSNDDSLFGVNAVSVGSRTRQQSAVNSISCQITPSNDISVGSNAISVGTELQKQSIHNSIRCQITPSNTPYNESLVSSNAVSVGTGILHQSVLSEIPEIPEPCIHSTSMKHDSHGQFFRSDTRKSDSINQCVGVGHSDESNTPLKSIQPDNLSSYDVFSRSGLKNAESRALDTMDHADVKSSERFNKTNSTGSTVPDDKPQQVDLPQGTRNSVCQYQNDELEVTEPNFENSVSFHSKKITNDNEEDTKSLIKLNTKNVPNKINCKRKKRRRTKICMPKNWHPKPSDEVNVWNILQPDIETYKDIDKDMFKSFIKEAPERFSLYLNMTRPSTSHVDPCHDDDGVCNKEEQTENNAGTEDMDKHPEHSTSKKIELAHEKYQRNEILKGKGQRQSSERQSPDCCEEINEPEKDINITKVFPELKMTGNIRKRTKENKVVVKREYSKRARKSIKENKVAVKREQPKRAKKTPKSYSYNVDDSLLSDNSILRNRTADDFLCQRQSSDPCGDINEPEKDVKITKVSPELKMTRSMRKRMKENKVAVKREKPQRAKKTPRSVQNNDILKDKGRIRKSKYMVEYDNETKKLKKKWFRNSVINGTSVVLITKIKKEDEDCEILDVIQGKDIENFVNMTRRSVSPMKEKDINFVVDELNRMSSIDILDTPDLKLKDVKSFRQAVKRRASPRYSQVKANKSDSFDARQTRSKTKRTPTVDKNMAHLSDTTSINIAQNKIDKRSKRNIKKKTSSVKEIENKISQSRQTRKKAHKLFEIRKETENEHSSIIKDSVTTVKPMKTTRKGKAAKQVEANVGTTEGADGLMKNKGRPRRGRPKKIDLIQAENKTETQAHDTSKINKVYFNEDTVETEMIEDMVAMEVHESFALSSSSLRTEQVLEEVNRKHCEKKYNPKNKKRKTRTKSHDTLESGSKINKENSIEGTVETEMVEESFGFMSSTSKTEQTKSLSVDLEEVNQKHCEKKYSPTNKMRKTRTQSDDTLESGSKINNENGNEDMVDTEMVEEMVAMKVHKSFAFNSSTSKTEQTKLLLVDLEEVNQNHCAEKYSPKNKKRKTRTQPDDTLESGLKINKENDNEGAVDTEMAEEMEVPKSVVLKTSTLKKQSCKRRKSVRFSFCPEVEVIVEEDEATLISPNRQENLNISCIHDICPKFNSTEESKLHERPVNKNDVTEVVTEESSLRPPNQQTNINTTSPHYSNPKSNSKQETVPTENGKHDNKVTAPSCLEFTHVPDDVMPEKEQNDDKITDYSCCLKLTHVSDDVMPEKGQNDDKITDTSCLESTHVPDDGMSVKGQNDDKITVPSCLEFTHILDDVMPEKLQNASFLTTSDCTVAKKLMFTDVNDESNSPVVRITRSTRKGTNTKKLDNQQANPSVNIGKDKFIEQSNRSRKKLRNGDIRGISEDPIATNSKPDCLESIKVSVKTKRKYIRKKKQQKPGSEENCSGENCAVAISSDTAPKGTLPSDVGLQHNDSDSNGMPNPVNGATVDEDKVDSSSLKNASHSGKNPGPKRTQTSKIKNVTPTVNITESEIIQTSEIKSANANQDNAKENLVIGHANTYAGDATRKRLTNCDTQRKQSLPIFVGRGELAQRKRKLFSKKENSLMTSGYSMLQESTVNSTQSRINSSVMPKTLATFLQGFIAPKLKTVKNQQK